MTKTEFIEWLKEYVNNNTSQETDKIKTMLQSIDVLTNDYWNCVDTTYKLDELSYSVDVQNSTSGTGTYTVTVSSNEDR